MAREGKWGCFFFVGWLGGGREAGAERVWWMDGWMGFVRDRLMNAVGGRDGVGRRARGE